MRLGVTSNFLKRKELLVKPFGGSPGCADGARGGEKEGTCLRVTSSDLVTGLKSLIMRTARPQELTD